MMGHHEMNGGLTSPGVYAGLHISPQMSAAAAAAYGRSPMVTLLFNLDVFVKTKLLSVIRLSTFLVVDSTVLLYKLFNFEWKNTLHHRVFSLLSPLEALTPSGLSTTKIVKKSAVVGVIDLYCTFEQTVMEGGVWSFLKICLRVSIFFAIT